METAVFILSIVVFALLWSMYHVYMAGYDACSQTRARLVDSKVCELEDANATQRSYINQLEHRNQRLVGMLADYSAWEESLILWLDKMPTLGPTKEDANETHN